MAALLAGIMIEPRKFRKLKLKELLPKREIDFTFGMEYLGKIWFGETFVFSHALKLFSNPLAVKSIAITVDDLEVSELQRLCVLLDIDLTIINSRDSVEKYIGAIHQIDEFVEDRKTFNVFSGDGQYELGFTILNEGKLIYFTAETIDVSYNKHMLR